MNKKFNKTIALFITMVLLLTAPSFNIYAQESVVFHAQQITESNNIETSTTTLSTSNTSTTIPSTTEPETTKNQMKSISLAESDMTIGLSEKVQVTVRDQNKKKIPPADITFTTSSKRIATVDSNGNVMGKKKGTAIITAKTKNDETASCNITVKSAPTSISLNIVSAAIGIGEKSVDLNSSVTGGYSKQRKYISSNTKIATVNSSGIVTGISEGTAIITCVTFNNKKANCKITVGKKPTSIKITNSNNVIQKGADNHRVICSLSKGSYSYKMTYSVKDKSIAIIDSNGFITGKKNGKTTVTVKTYNGLTATQNITVRDNSLPLNINSTQLALDNKNVQKVKYGTSVQGRNLEAFIISNSETDNTLSQECKIKASGSVNVRSGPGTSYSIVLSLKNGTKVTRIEKAVKKANGYTWDKIVLNNKKTGYIATNYLVLVKDNTITKKTLFMDFAIHGFEDEYYRDGRVLVEEANSLIEYFANHTSQLKNYKLVIVPCANPDGTIAGINNQRACNTAFGRCTSKHIDMNRDWDSFRAIETKKLKDFIVKTKPNFYLNMHGWLNETLGDSNLNTIINKELGLEKQLNNNYPSNYSIGWVHKNLKIPATLVEYKSSSSVSTEKDIQMITAIINSNGKAPSLSAKKFPMPIEWKNGSTAEPVYKISNLTEKSDSIKAKASAKCYRKLGNSYIVVYNYGNDKHKTGFVKYSGGVKKAPTESKTYKNGSTSETVYADTAKKTKIGSLDAKESCQCLGEIDGMYLVCYKVNGTSNYKCGFVVYSGSC